MTKIEIEAELKQICPSLRLGIIQCRINTKEECPDLWQVINENTVNIQQNLAISGIVDIPSINSSKKGYRAVGKDPSRYRLSAESLLRRIVNGKGLYKINNVVDLLNLVSITSGFSIGGYNADKIEGVVRFGIGKADEAYEGIGRGSLNIDKLPVFRDDLGAFGSPTSDSLRTQIDETCKNFLMIIISFQAEKALPEAMNLAIDLLKKHAEAKEIQSVIL
ncbi:phenylalanine--tRNA ligase beta subunit-related protein [Labilibaculum sp. K2S]|uniref:B3/B4 domain-containing protein n=1 Tax=Labilibaculum sp. K2S TaxID=3056386 RepID=UPI0025A4874E|nr:phenylalanine--tRNA ligase beta subunit-related protein [Labilibaculum sp. K2S]MDM8162127.1 phenylalanine--tRNA ligase beta subunit-related protein [Labilibaculum sp. K2S]